MIVQLAIENANAVYQYVEGNKPTATKEDTLPKRETFNEKLCCSNGYV